jgi:hypothetical protein
MSDPLENDESSELQERVSRRMFIQGVIAASAAARVGALASSAAPRRHAAAPLNVLTAEQSGTLTAVLNRLIPSNAVMPAAGDLGVGQFIESALAEAPHLRTPILRLLAELPSPERLRQQSPADLDSELQRLEREHSESFDILLQATYTGYYSHLTVLDALGWTDPDEAPAGRAFFDAALLEDVRKRGPMYRDV